jgi:hypothetical protein
VAGASVLLKSATSEWSQETQTDQDGEFAFAAVPLGDYIVTAKAAGFSPLQQSFTLASDTSSILHLQLAVAALSEKVVVAAPEKQQASIPSLRPRSSTGQTSRRLLAPIPPTASR